MATFVQRIIGAARLNPATYEEVEADKSATIQALSVVVLSAIATGVGSVGEGLRGVVFTILAWLVGWWIWAFLTWLIGTKFLAEPDTKADIGELLRTLGFASAPGLVMFLGVIPHLTSFLVILVWFWMLATTVVAVRQALDYKGTGKAIVVCLIGWFVYVLFVVSVLSMLGIAIIGLGAMMSGGH
ncbi:MAG: YIP1 family protein [Candidatus Eiseniibacteriota bacterium]